MATASSSICRWGILGSAAIARKNWQAIRNAGNATLAAVASRSVDRSRAWIAENQAQVPFDATPEAIEGYDALIEHPDVDALYIPLPTGLRKEWVLKAAAAGKHVLCEKPCGIDAEAVAEMVAACAAAGVQFMDGVMFMHSARLDALRQVLDDPQKIGRLRRIASQFSFLAPDDFFADNIRTRGDLEPLGCLGDLGWYNVRLTLWAMNYEMPVAVSGRLLSVHGDVRVPTELSAEMRFADGASASFYCSFLTEHQQWANLSGTAGNVQIDDFVLPFHGDEAAFELHQSEFQTDGCHFHMLHTGTRHAVAEPSDSAPQAQESQLFRTFSDLVLGGTPDPRWPEIALKTQQVVDACLRSAREGGRELTIQ